MEKPEEEGEWLRRYSTKFHMFNGRDIRDELQKYDSAIHRLCVITARTPLDVECKLLRGLDSAGGFKKGVVEQGDKGN